MWERGAFGNATSITYEERQKTERLKYRKGKGYALRKIHWVERCGFILVYALKPSDIENSIPIGVHIKIGMTT